MIGIARRRVMFNVEKTFIIVGPDAIKGDVRAGNYFLLNLATMKQLVGSPSEVTDSYKEYIGPIYWSVAGRDASYGTITNEGTEGDLDVLSGASSAQMMVCARIRNAWAYKTITATYAATDYVISSLSDMQDFANAVKNGTEHSLVSASTNGDGFINRHIRLGADIDFNSTVVEIGSYTSTSSYKAFKGWFDGAGYEMKNIVSTGRTGLFACTYGTSSNHCKLSNFTISGSVTNNTGPNGIVWANQGYLEFDRVFNKMNVRSNSTANVLMWNSADVDMETFFYDCVFGGTVHNGSTAAKHVSVNYMTSYVRGYTYIGTITATSNQSKIWAVPCPRSKYETGTSSNPQIKDVLYLGSATVYGGNSVFTAWANNSYYENCLVAKNMGAGSMGYFYSTSGSYTINNTKCFYDSQVCTRITAQGATGKTTSEVKSGALFSDSRWIEKNGYYPMINNQFAVRPEMLAAIRS